LTVEKGSKDDKPSSAEGDKPVVKYYNALKRETAKDRRALHKPVDKLEIPK